jgi:type IV pilus assembly protein PilA
MLILGLLAAIAIPAFFNQREKASDASAKSMARTAETAMETYATDNNGSYAGVTAAELNHIENTINAAPTANDPGISAVSGTTTGYSVTIKTPKTGNTFTISREGGGNVVFSCEDKGEAGCPTDGDWAH